jgi:Arrestin (or S-antigen), N-terminal domain
LIQYSFHEENFFVIYRIYFQFVAHFTRAVVGASLGAEKAEGSIPVLPRGYRQFPFHFLLPESCLPCSFESKIGTIRYYIKVSCNVQTLT